MTAADPTALSPAAYGIGDSVKRVEDLRFLRGLGRSKIEYLEAIPQAAHVHVGIDQARHDRQAFGVDAAGGRPHIGIDVLTDSQHFTVLYRNSGNDGFLRVHRVNSRAGDR